MLVYLFIINATGLALMLMDKYKARKNLWRIPENTLLGIALIGGSLGCILGMRFTRHKTKHPKFSIGLPVIFAVQVMVLLFLYLT